MVINYKSDDNYCNTCSVTATLQDTKWEWLEFRRAKSPAFFSHSSLREVLRKGVLLLFSFVQEPNVN